MLAEALLPLTGDEAGKGAMSVPSRKREPSGNGQRQMISDDRKGQENKSEREMPIRGIARLVNPPEDEGDVIFPKEEFVEREYWGRILHVADRVLRRRKADS